MRHAFDYIRSRRVDWNITEIRIHTSDETRRSRRFVRLLIAVFFLVTIILIGVSITLLLTQEPVNLSGSRVRTSNVSDDNGTAKSSRLQFRRRRPEYRRFTFDDLFSGKVFLKDSYTIAWSRDGGFIQSKDEYLESPTVATVIKPGTFEATYYLADSSMMSSLSPSGKYTYEAETVKQFFRHSNEDLYQIRRLENGTVTGKPFHVGPTGDSTETVLAFKWNPDPNKNDFVFVNDYNLYYQMDPEKPGTATPITKDGNYLLRYGVPDWLYEEEILSSGDAIWWSDSGKYIAYMRFDDRAVNRIYIPKYLKGSQYPQYMEIPYPKAGVEENPITELYMYSLKTKKSVVVEPPAQLTNMNQSFYIFSNQWLKMPAPVSSSLGEERLATVWSNREQNLVYITLCNESDCVTAHIQSFTLKGRSMWAEPTDFKAILASETGFFTILPHPYTDGNIYNHVAHLKLRKNGGANVDVWHGGAYDVREIKGYDIQSDTLTFTSAGGGLGTMRLYKITQATMANQLSISSLSSVVSDCDYGSYEVSPDGRRAALSCIQPFRNTRMYLMDVNTPTNNKLLEGGEATHIPFDVPEISYEIVKLSSGFDVHVGIMKPPKFDLTFKYPVIVDVYGGPNSCRVRRSTPNPNVIHFCSNLGAIVVWIDGRGANNRGWNVKSPVYKTLGQYETADTIEAVKYLSSKYSYFDRKHMAVFGWVSSPK
ncbi:hypothetical protein Q1695_000815 [Nippostrongylus brasiliensis]|nr:hypothetical protein Q1695_000815 [Nippostrongylus brasiliensis]